MSTVYDIIIGVICKIVLLLSIVWQYIVWISDANSKYGSLKYVGPLLLDSTIPVFYAMTGLLALFSGYNKDGFFRVLSSIFGLTIIFPLKNLVGPFLVGLAVTWAVAKAYFFGVWELVPLFYQLAESLLFWAPNWAQLSYVWGALIWFLVSGVIALTEL